MKLKLFFLCILNCLVFSFISCNEATPEQIKETELASKKEQLLEEMHEEEVKELVNVLTEKAKDNSFYYFVNLGKNAEKVKDNPYYNIILFFVKFLCVEGCDDKDIEKGVFKYVVVYVGFCLY